ncbi:NAD(P)H-hydrate dehydratase [Methanocalculus taiwanensis]|uniref:ADP-dependent (S)-NAD(P)H-hydrate dehydratase n=1 Tax=Methanocalculus taiwanensis TaxID=106207 RepID=A0ABD4THH7_9EURY|nr:NAD(P)H-hydrate dehydratase [Methanocalculus taiwanensis]MCQ1538407.1 NAD(P)H-hydrate dehydratase [Methanocalculus taiwanensis]
MPSWLTEWEDEDPIEHSRMKAIERNAEALGVSTRQMMESAGRALAEEALMQSPEQVLVLCGRGNNGGDGFVAARYLARTMECSCIYVSGDRKGDSAANLKALTACGIPLHEVSCREDISRLADLFSSADLIIDALLGTGAGGNLREPIASCVAMANESPAYILSADLPTPGISADAILAFHRSKGIATSIADIGIPLEAECFTGPGDLLSIPKKPENAHKGYGGKVLVVGGGPYQGAPYLAGLAALRAGADIVFVASPHALDCPDLIHIPLPGRISGEEICDLLIKYAREADSVVIGPGLGAGSHDVVLRVAAAARRAVIDADALRLPLPAGGETIYTPHAGEFARAFGRDRSGNNETDAAIVRDACTENGIILLKGPTDIITDGRRIRFNRTGVPAMTVGGTGDILAGVAAALFCRMPAFEAAAIAAYVTGRAGEEAALAIGDGLIASDLLLFIAQILYGD